MKNCVNARFAGGEDTEIVPGLKGDWYIGCLTCNYQIRCKDCTEDEAVRYWNTRPAEEALKAEVERLKEKLNSVKAVLIFNKNRATDTGSWVFDLCDALIKGINGFLASEEKGGENEP